MNLFLRFAHRRFALAFTLAIAAFTVDPLAGQPAAGRPTSSVGEISAELYGQVTDPNGRGLQGIRIAADRLSTYDKKRTFERVETFSIAGGGFAFRGLKPGVYRICPSFAGGDLLPKCEWDPTMPTVGLGPGQLWHGFKLKMEQGKRVHIRVDDPDKHLQRSKQRRVNQVKVRVGVETKKGFRPAELHSEDAGGDNYVVLIPKGLAATVTVEGDGVEFQKGQGQGSGNSIGTPGRLVSESVAADDSVGVVVRVRASAPGKK